MRLALILMLALGGAVPVQDGRQPVPDAAGIRNAEKLIREIFKEDFARKAPADVLTLAQKLLQQGEQPDNELPTRYALFKLAQELAVQGGDAGLAVRAVDGLSKYFAVNGAPLKLAALQALAKSARTADEAKAASLKFLALADEALAADEAETAGKAADAASQLAKKVKEVALIARADAKSREAAARKAALEKLAKAREVLAKTPEDPAANHLVGFHLCAVKGDWEGGLPLLARGSDPVLKGLADRELSGPGDAAAQASLADGWWDLSEKTAEPAPRTRLRARALFWYEKAGDKLTGLTRAKVRSRVLELRYDQFGPRNQWVPLNDPKAFGSTKGTGEAMEITARQGEAEGLDCPLPPGAEYDAIAARIRFAPGAKSHGGVALEGRTILAYVDYVGKYFMFAHLVDRRWVRDFERQVGEREEYHVCIVVADGEYRAYLDGLEMCRVKTTLSRLIEPGLQVSHGPALFDQVRIRKK